MRVPIVLGTDLETGRPFCLDPEATRTHVHALGSTGSGKTTALISLLRPLLMTSMPKSACFLVDPVGNFSHDLLLWMADTTCPQHVRDRLIYLEPARDNWVMPFHPLRAGSDDQRYYQVARSLDIVLRGFGAQRTEEMPRLRYWTFACFFSLAAMGLPLAACQWLLRPGTDEHKAILLRLPPRLQAIWAEILASRGEAMKQLESTRSRLSLFSDCGILRRMFGSTNNHFDVARFIRERRIVICNVGSYGVVDHQVARTIGGFIVNEVIQTAMSMTPLEVNPTFLVLDEFQHFVGLDLYEALPLVRQLGLRLVLAHQSLSQLVRGDVDLTGLIWQARSRLMFASDFEDADILANELTTLSYDPYKLKETLYSHRQRTAGFRREFVQGTSSTETTSSAIDHSHSVSEGEKTGVSRAPDADGETKSSGKDRSESRGHSEKEANSRATSHSQNETLVPILEDLEEVSSKSYFSFEDQMHEWARRIRQQRTGCCYAKIKDDPKLYHLAITNNRVVETPSLLRKLDELLAKNFESDLFRTKQDIEREEAEQRQQLLSGDRISFRTSPLSQPPASPPMEDTSSKPPTDDDDPPSDNTLPNRLK